MNNDTQIWLMKVVADLKERRKKEHEKACKVEQRKHKDNKIR
jgi:hypothetical protein